MQRRWFVLVGLTIVGLVLAGTALPASQSNARSTASAGWVKTAKQRLAKLDVKAAGSMAGYQPREVSFGLAWSDVDLNDCDTRNAILVRDLRQVVLKAGSTCIVANETLKDPYTGKAIKFVRGVNSNAIQIDHVVALAAAWRTGAKQWTSDERLFYANDSLVLLAVDGPTNQAKSDGDAAEWLPPKAKDDCLPPKAKDDFRYVAKQIAIKTKSSLWVTQPEKMAMSAVLGGC